MREVHESLTLSVAQALELAEMLEDESNWQGLRAFGRIIWTKAARQQTQGKSEVVISLGKLNNLLQSCRKAELTQAITEKFKEWEIEPATTSDN